MKMFNTLTSGLNFEVLATKVCKARVYVCVMGRNNSYDLLFYVCMCV